MQHKAAYPHKKEIIEKTDINKNKYIFFPGRHLTRHSYGFARLFNK